MFKLKRINQGILFMFGRLLTFINLTAFLLFVGLLSANEVHIKVADCQNNGDGTVSYRLDVLNDQPFEGWQFLINPYPILTGPGISPYGGLAQEMGHMVSLGPNGMMLGINFQYLAIPANTEFTHLTTVNYTYAGGYDPCTMTMELNNAFVGEFVTVWGNTYTFSGHIVSYVECSDGISETGHDCILNGGETTIVEADLIWHAYEPVSLGDVNMDGGINVMDIVLIINHILGNVLLEDDQFIHADMNGDGSADVTDIIQIVNIILSD